MYSAYDFGGKRISSGVNGSGDEDGDDDLNSASLSKNSDGGGTNRGHRKKKRRHGHKSSKKHRSSSRKGRKKRRSSPNDPSSIANGRSKKSRKGRSNNRNATSRERGMTPGELLEHSLPRGNNKTSSNTSGMPGPRKKLKKKRKANANQLLPGHPGARAEADQKNLPIITEEDNESNFSAAYQPTQYAALGQFTYHTWGKDSDVKPPNEDRIVRVGPSIWHWDWDLSFGLYDELYDSIASRFSNSDILEDTWLNFKGPIQTWQPLLAALLWFFSSMIILFPVSLIGQSTVSRYDHTTPDPTPSMPNSIDRSVSAANIDDSDNLQFNIATRTISIDTNYAHTQIGCIFAMFELSVWLSASFGRKLILYFGPSPPIVFGLLLMAVSQFFMAKCQLWYNWNFFGAMIGGRLISGVGFSFFRESSLFFWSYFPKLDMLASGLGLCIGPVFGDLLRVYAGWEYAFYVYGSLLCVCTITVLLLTSAQYLTKADVSRCDIPLHIKNIRKPRYDLLHYKVRSQSRLSVYLKGEILLCLVVVLTALEPILPLYCVNPRVSVTVSGALFTLFYLILLSISSLLGFIYSKSNAKLFTSAQKHIKSKRRGMPYITKTVSINIRNPRPGRSRRGGQNIGVTKSEQIKLVEKPSWLLKRKKMLPSPDIGQHHFGVLIGLIVVAIGFFTVSCRMIFTSITYHPASDLVIGLLLISSGAAWVIVACFDSFVNGLSIHTNQVQMACLAIYGGAIIGPILGGLALDKVGLRSIFTFIGYIILAHFVLYLTFHTIRLVYTNVFAGKLSQLLATIASMTTPINTDQNSKPDSDKPSANTDPSNHSIDGSTKSKTVSRSFAQQRNNDAYVPPSTLTNVSLNNDSPHAVVSVVSGSTAAAAASVASATASAASAANVLILSNDGSNTGLQSTPQTRRSTLETEQSLRNSHSHLHSGAAILKDEIINALLPPLQQSGSVGGASNDGNDPNAPGGTVTTIPPSSDESSRSNDGSNIDDKTKILCTTTPPQLLKKADTVQTNTPPLMTNASELIDVQTLAANKSLKSRLNPNPNPKSRLNPNPNSNSNAKPNPKSKSKSKVPNSDMDSEKKKSMVFVHGNNLRHLCWWKRGLSVRFPYIQWLDSGWSNTRVKRKITSALSTVMDDNDTSSDESE